MATKETRILYLGKPPILPHGYVGDIHPEGAVIRFPGQVRDHEDLASEHMLSVDVVVISAESDYKTYAASDMFLVGYARALGIPVVVRGDVPDVLLQTAAFWSRDTWKLRVALAKLSVVATEPMLDAYAQTIAELRQEARSA